MKEQQKIAPRLEAIALFANTSRKQNSFYWTIFRRISIHFIAFAINGYAVTFSLNNYLNTSIILIFLAELVNWLEVFRFRVAQLPRDSHKGLVSNFSLHPSEAQHCHLYEDNPFWLIFLTVNYMLG